MTPSTRIFSLFAALCLTVAGLQAQGTRITPAQIDFRATFASPPVGRNLNTPYMFTDALSTGLCVGGGSSLSWCVWNGTAFVAVSSSVVLPVTTSALKGDGAGNAAAVAGTSTNCVHVDGSSAVCASGANASLTTVALSATPALVVTSNSTPQVFQLSAPLNTSIVPTLNLASATPGQQIGFTFTQNGTGGWGITWPATVLGACALDGAPNVTTTVIGTFNGTNVVNPSCATDNPVHSLTIPQTSSGAPVFSPNSFTLFTPAIATAFGWKLPTAAATGILRGDNSGGTVTLSQVKLTGVCDFLIGDTSGSALSSGQLGPQVGICFVPAPATVVEVNVRADAGTPNIIVGVDHGGVVSNLVSAALATATAGARACSKTAAVSGIDGLTTCSATLQNTALAAGDYMQAVSGTAGGVAKWMTVHIVYLIN